MPRISVVLPTFNRAATLRRAVQSVLGQSFGDLELIVVDDGSTDGSTDGLEALDRRIVLLRQANAGVSSARNAGLRRAAGELLAFIDSDDEWLPFHLDIAASFFDAHPEEDILQTEILVRFDDGAESVLPREEIAIWYPRLAAKTGSRLLDLPPGQHDGYMRVFAEKHDAAWMRPRTAERLGAVPHYRGAVYAYLRWGYLTSLVGLVITRRGRVTAGWFDERLRTAEDFAFMANLLRAFPLNLIAVPGSLVHMGKRDDHLATGALSALFRENLYRQIGEVLETVGAGESERRLLLGFKGFDVAEAAMRRGDRATALHYLDISCSSIPRFWRGRIVRFLLRATRSSLLTTALYEFLLRIERLRRWFPSGERHAIRPGTYIV